MNNITEYQMRPRRKSKLPLEVETEKTIRSLVYTLAAMILVLSVIFFSITTQSAQKGYTLEQQKIRNEDLKARNNNLSAKLTQASTFNSLEDSGKLRKMTEIDARIYVTEKDNDIK